MGCGASQDSRAPPPARARYLPRYRGARFHGDDGARAARARQRFSAEQERRDDDAMLRLRAADRPSPTPFDLIESPALQPLTLALADAPATPETPHPKETFSLMARHDDAPPAESLLATLGMKLQPLPSCTAVSSQGAGQSTQLPENPRLAGPVGPSRDAPGFHGHDHHKALSLPTPCQ
uniref:Uncharacterized protein n=1 Tax=Neobodo designis TaxID=312471 RepID=A0A7S1M9Q4_NEODS|mmetsp:Transcript_3646/g.11460  ORF Transcript_3646/g.11460 Transcript_3646/m.11460 type:complete len:179 (+) Transcript_3646:37-573(+)